MIIGLIGQAQHGKDTVGAYLVEQYSFRRYAFADALKDMALVLNPIVDIFLEGWDEPEAACSTLQEVYTKLGWERAKQIPEVRRFLQVLGTEGVRATFGDNAWVQVLQDKLVRDGQLDDFLGFGGLQPAHDARVVITDVRFPNEAEWVARYGTLIKVVRPNFDNGVDSTHPSEAFVAKLTPNITVVNDGTIADLYDSVAQAMASRMVRW